MSCRPWGKGGHLTSEEEKVKACSFSIGAREQWLQKKNSNVGQTGREGKKVLDRYERGKKKGNSGGPDVGENSPKMKEGVHCQS